MSPTSTVRSCPVALAWVAGSTAGWIIVSIVLERQSLYTYREVAAALPVYLLVGALAGFVASHCQWAALRPFFNQSTSAMCMLWALGVWPGIGLGLFAGGRAVTWSLPARVEFRYQRQGAGNWRLIDASTGAHLHFTVFARTTFYVSNSKSCGPLPQGGDLNPAGYLF